MLQQEDIDNAVTAQSKLQQKFGDGLTVGDARNLSISVAPGGNTIDLVGYRLNLGNGSWEGGLNGTLSRRAILGRGGGLGGGLWGGL